MSNIDGIDRRILKELQADARRSNTALASAASVSPSTMLSRVRSLEKRGVITGYHADVDLESLDRRIEAMVSIQLDAKTPDDTDKFIEQMWKMEETIAVTMLTGAFDVVVHITARDIASLGDLVLRRIASVKNVKAEQTSIVFSHRRKHVLNPLDELLR